MLPQNIDAVIDRLDQIIQEAIANDSPLGLFAALYQKVTIAVKEGIQAERFDESRRMERLDVIFANRYIAAYEAFQKGAPTSSSWQTAFEAVKKRDLIFLQHIFLGINAHINLDLGLATAETMRGKNLNDIKADFEMINTVLFELMKEVQVGLGMVSPLLFLADVVSDDKDERIASFSLKSTRIHAWKVAERFHSIQNHSATEIAPTEFTKALNQLDKEVTKLALLIQPNGWLKRILLNLVYRFEKKNLNRAIRNLYGAPLANRVLKN